MLSVLTTKNKKEKEKKERIIMKIKRMRRNFEAIDMSMTLMLVMVSQYRLIPKLLELYIKYIQILHVSHTSIKCLKKKLLIKIEIIFSLSLQQGMFFVLVQFFMVLAFTRESHREHLHISFLYIRCPRCQVAESKGIYIYKYDLNHQISL